MITHEGVYVLQVAARVQAHRGWEGGRRGAGEKSVQVWD